MMMANVLMIAMVFLARSSAQNINCSSVVGNNFSALAVTTYPAYHGYPVPAEALVSIYPNNTAIMYQFFGESLFLKMGSGLYNISNSNDNNFPCIFKINWDSGPMNGNASCYMVGFTSNPSGVVGCYDWSSPACPSSCSPQYILGMNHTRMGWIYLNSINSEYGKPERKAPSVSCDAIIGHNTSLTVSLNEKYLYTPSQYYFSIYNNGSLVTYGFDEQYYGAAVYNVSVSSSPNVECVIEMHWTDGMFYGQNWCMSYSMNSNGTAGIGCWNYEGHSCQSSCDAADDFKYNPWATFQHLNSV